MGCGGGQRHFRIVCPSSISRHAAVLVATADDAVRAVLGHWAANKGLRVAVVYKPSAVWEALASDHAIRLVLFTTDDAGQAGLDAVYQLAHRGWFTAEVHCDLRRAIAEAPQLGRTSP